MPISTPTLLATSTSQTSAASQTTASVAPPASALLIVWQWVGTVSGGTTAPSFSAPTTTLGGIGAWSSATATVVAGRAWRGTIWWAMCGAAPGTGTITINATASQPRWGWIVAYVTGHNATTPVAQSQPGSSATSSLSLTLPSAPASDSIVIGGVGSHALLTGSVTPGTGFVELTETGNIDSAGHVSQLQYNMTPTSSCAWTSLNTAGNAGVAIEIKAAAAAATIANAHIHVSGF